MWRDEIRNSIKDLQEEILDYNDIVNIGYYTQPTHNDIKGEGVMYQIGENWIQSDAKGGYYKKADVLKVGSCLG